MTEQENSGLVGKVALITGGSRGIGRAIVERMARSGMKVFFTYVSGKEAAEEVVAANADLKIYAQRADVKDSKACQSLVEELVEKEGRIDLLVNNAGIIRDNILPMLEDDDISSVLETNVAGAFYMARAVMPYMISQRSGSIINISSVSGEKGGRGQTNYAASKGAINAFTRSLSVEAARRGIRVNAVAPGFVETDMTEEVRDLAGDEVLSRILLRRIGQPEDIANAVWFLSSAFASYITGQVLHVDGGFKME